MIRHIWALALFCSVFEISAQKRTDFFAYADDNFARGEWEVALLNYNRLLFTSTETNEQARLNYQIGSCYFLMGAFDLAENYFDFAYFSAESDSMQTEAVLAKTRALIRQERYVLALFELANLTPENTTYFDGTIALYTGLCHFHQNKFEEATPYFLAVLGNDSLARMELATVLSSRKLLHRPNPNLAHWLSLLPGTGQFYAGDVKNGFNSLLLNVSLFAMGANVVQSLSFIDAMVSVAPWIQRYYYGGMVAAERIATDKRHNNRQLALGQVLDLIQANKGIQQ
jgi:tetratricopeptide (TPR) repeat protein